MNTHFFKLAFRKIIRNKFHSLINIIGFSIGIATVLFIFLFIKTETSFDDFHPDGKRIYRVIEISDSKDDHYITGYTRYPEAPAITNSIPGIDDFCRVSRGRNVKCFRGKQLFKIDRLRFTDDNFFDFFSFSLLEGDPQTALNSADKIVLSHKLSLLLFDKADPLGQSIIYNQKLFTVSGISKDPPANTHLQFDALISIKHIEKDKENYWLGWGGGMEFLSYIKLSPGIPPTQIEAGLPDLFYEKINKRYEPIGLKLTATLQNITDIHLSNGEIKYDCPDNRSSSSIMIVASIGLLILILAIVNYISLYVAQKNEKIRDIILLSIHGAGRWQLILQSFIEVLIISFISSLSGIYLFTLFTPMLNNYLETSVDLNHNLIQAFLFIVFLNFLLSFIITLYSTQSIFKFKITDPTKGSLLPGGKRSIINNILVTFQFTIVIILLIAVLVINRQNNFVLQQDLGFTKENILSIFPDKEFKNNELSGFRQEILNLPEISYVSLSSQSVGTGLTMNGYTITGESLNTMLNVIYADAEFLDCFGIKLTSGRNFKKGISQDNNSIIVNNKLVQRAGWKDPINQTIDRNGRMTVIGTVADFNFASLKSEIFPLIIMCNPAYDGWGYNCVNIRFQTGDIQRLVKRISQQWERDFTGIPYEISFLDDQLAGNYKSFVDQQKIVTFFSMLSILIACMGLFGLASFVAKCRTKEVGIRRINGAKVREVIILLNNELLKWVLMSMVIAIPLAWYAMHKWLENFAYKTELSWWIFALAVIIALGIAFLTVSWQSWRAATRNPVEALRDE
jgi:putative ABC transport system permease protein